MSSPSPSPTRCTELAPCHSRVSSWSTWARRTPPRRAPCAATCASSSATPACWTSTPWAARCCSTSSSCPSARPRARTPTAPCGWSRARPSWCTRAPSRPPWPDGSPTSTPWSWACAMATRPCRTRWRACARGA
ncbi:hypothetical protein D187_010284 [Cystobacter fuscus DSM 2262]|uniref:Uncharacterized protein n=1 Tax=Cystobacter fuscus (strain ATCC 25194 / DSM 2262 / NBRC 100088 / M29) TaxID=1242864 RepID=S9PB94_CYSF2|nr:hypothetical protein D187_010284 [Cystobacter fuscus DSM 2262]